MVMLAKPLDDAIDAAAAAQAAGMAVHVVLIAAERPLTHEEGDVAVAAAWPEVLLCGRYERSARALLVNTPAQRTDLLLPFTLEARGDWNYTPRSRAGVAFKAMEGRAAPSAQQLLAAALSEPGLVGAGHHRHGDRPARESNPSASRAIRRTTPSRCSARRTPTSPWGWRMKGTISRCTSRWLRAMVGHARSSWRQPGAGAARYRQLKGPRKDQRALGEEEDRAFALLAALSPAQRQQAIFSARPFGDIVTRNAAQLDPLAPVGLAFGAMDAAQQALLLRIVRVAGLGGRTVDGAAAAGSACRRAAWRASASAGPAPPSARQPHYWRIQGARFLVEWDNSGGNHIHSVWRDFQGDWGRDVLGYHYRRARAQQPPALTDEGLLNNDALRPNEAAAPHRGRCARHRVLRDRPGRRPAGISHAWISVRHPLLTYAEWRHSLAAAGCRVLVPYLRGYGPTRFLRAWTHRAQASQAALGADLLALDGCARHTARGGGPATAGAAAPPAWWPRSGPERCAGLQSFNS